MEVLTKCRDRNLEIFLKGELDHYGAQDLLKQMEEVITRNLPLTLTMDFSDVTFMDSSGIAVVLRSWQRMKTLDGNVILRHVSPQPRKVFDAANISRMVTIE